MTLYRRPEYTRRVLDNLLRCSGIEKYKIIIFVEPGNRHVIDMANTFNFKNKEVHLNKSILGCNRNILNSIDYGMSISDYNIHIEDDILPGRDMLKYFEFCDFKYRYKEEIMTVCAYHKGKYEENYKDKIFKNKWFTPWGWATWKDRWEELKKKWDYKISWDVHLNNVVRQNRYEIRPFIARTQNIGQYHGEHVSSEMYLKEHFNQFWINSINSENINNFIECDF